MSPKVSIIVPVHNTREFLVECVDSITEQSVGNLEILLVDDGSSDGSHDLMDELADRDARIKTLTTGRIPQGPGRARNLGLEYATGEVVSFVDSDDYVDHRFIELLLPAITDIGADISICTIAKFSDSEVRERFGRCSYEANLGYLDGQMFHWRDIGPELFNLRFASWNKLYRRSILDEFSVNFSEGIFYEDMIFTFGALLHARQIAFTNAKLYYNRRQRDGAITNTHGGRVYDSLEAFRQVGELLASDSDFDQLRIPFDAFRFKKLVQYLHKNDVDHITDFYNQLRRFAIEHPSIEQSPELSEKYRSQFESIVSLELWPYLVQEYWSVTTENARLRRRVRSYKQRLLAANTKAQRQESTLDWFRESSAARIAASRALIWLRRNFRS